MATFHDAQEHLIFCIMENIEQIRGFVSNLLKPIVKEAILEVTGEKENTPEDQYYTPAQVQDMLHIGQTTFYRYVNKGKFHLIKLGGKSLVLKSELDAALDTDSVGRYKR